MNIAASILLALTIGQLDAARFVVETTDAALPANTLSGLAEDFTLVLGRDKALKVEGKTVVSLRHADLPTPPSPDKNVLWLTSGDRIPLDAKSSLRLDQDRLLLRAGAPIEGRADLSISINYASLFWLDDDQPPAARSLFLSRLDREARSRDVILLRNGDRLEGTLKHLKQGDAIGLEMDGKEKRVLWDDVAGLAFSTEFRARPRLKGPFAHLVLSSGARLSLTRIAFDEAGQRLSGKVTAGGQLEVALTDVRALDVWQGPAVYLSDLTPKSYRHESYLGVAWPLMKDASAAGRGLRLGANTFDKGLGMHSQSEATYDLAGQYRWFEAIVGLDEVAGRRGRIKLRVLVDGKEQEMGDGLRTWRSGPLPLRIDVRNARQLTLAVDFADYADVEAHVDWANARLVK